MKKFYASWLVFGCSLGLMLGCQAEAPAPVSDKAEAPAKVEAAVRGVDAANKVIRIGTLNDESGPAAVIGKPFAAGKRILAAEVNAGGTDILPEGWKIELVEKDHGYNPGKSEAAYKEIKDQVLFLGTSFGTPNTLPLRPYLQQDNMVAFPASLSSAMAGFEHTPPAGASYTLEAMRAMDWIVESAGGADKVKVGIIYDQTDYGKDGYAGLKAAAQHYETTIAAEQTIAPGQKDFTAVIGALKKAGATHVILTVLASSTGPILGTSAKMGYMPTWVGQTPSWIDPFFAHPQLPAQIFAKFVWLSGMPFWGEPVPGMDKFLAAYETHGKPLKARPDFYTMMSYIQGRLALEAAKQALALGALNPDTYMTALRNIDGWNAGGMIQPVSLKTFPYATATQVRILKPDFEKKSWAVVADYAEAKSMVKEEIPAKKEAQAAAPEGEKDKAAQ